MTTEEFREKTAAKRIDPNSDTAEIPLSELPPQPNPVEPENPVAAALNRAASIPPEVWVQIILAALDFLTKWLDRRRGA